MSVPPLDLDKIHLSADWAKVLVQRPGANPWLDTYAEHVPALLAELDRLRERVAELEARQEATCG